MGELFLNQMDSRMSRFSKFSISRTTNEAASPTTNPPPSNFSKAHAPGASEQQMSPFLAQHGTKSARKMPKISSKLASNTSLKAQTCQARLRRLKFLKETRLFSSLQRLQMQEEWQFQDSKWRKTRRDTFGHEKKLITNFKESWRASGKRAQKLQKNSVTRATISLEQIALASKSWLTL